MKYLILVFITISIFTSCTKDIGTADNCNIAAKWNMIDTDNPFDPITIVLLTLEFKSNGDMLFSGLNSHEWKINDDCTLLEFWMKSHPESKAVMKILHLDDRELEMELIRGTISAFDLVALALGIDIAKFIRAK